MQLLYRLCTHYQTRPISLDSIFILISCIYLIIHVVKYLLKLELDVYVKIVHLIQTRNGHDMDQNYLLEIIFWQMMLILRKISEKGRHFLSSVIYPSLRTDTHITFSLHFTPLGIRLSAFVAQPGAFLVLETIILGYYSTCC